MALEEKRTGAKYLGVSSTGTFFERSKEEKDGFEKYVSEKTGAVSYRKNYTGVSGYITGIYEREIEVDSAKIKMFNLEITDEGEIDPTANKQGVDGRYCGVFYQSVQKYRQNKKTPIHLQ